MNDEMVPSQQAAPRTRNAETLIRGRAQERLAAQAADRRVCDTGVRHGCATAETPRRSKR